MTTVLITGARGFIARHLAPVLAAEGYRVIGTSRTPGELPAFSQVHTAALGDSLWSLLTGERVDAIVHTALESGAQSYARNVSGVTKWLQEGKQAGVTTQILLSSLSADEAALADYGRAKAALEQKFIEANELVFRLGVVVGNGGMFARMVAAATRYPIVPLLDGGSQLIYVVGVDTLSEIIRDAVRAGGEGLRGRAWNTQQPNPYPLTAVLQSILKARGRRGRFVSVPAQPLARLLALWEAQQVVRLPVTSTNIRGLIQSATRRFPSDFERFGYPERSLDELVAAASAAGG